MCGIRILCMYWYKLALGYIRKVKMVWYCHEIPWYHGIVTVTKSLLIFCISTVISVPQCINIHIKCSVARLEVSHRPNFPEVTICKCIYIYSRTSIIRISIIRTLGYLNTILNFKIL